MFKKFASAAAVCACAVFFMGTASAEQVLRVGTEATFAPFEFMEQGSDEPTGYDIDIIKAIGAAEGFKVEVVNMPFDGLIPAMLTSQIDAAIAGITITPERAKKVNFSDPYYNSGLSAVILASNTDKYKKISDLSSSRICVQIGTTGAKNAQRISGKVGAFNTVPEAFMELKAKGCEAVMNDRPVNLYFLSKMHSDEYVEIPEILDGEQYGIAVGKNNPEVLEAINSGFKKIRENGTFAEIHKKWFKVAE